MLQSYKPLSYGNTNIDRRGMNAYVGFKAGTDIDIYKKHRCPTSYTTHVKIRSGS